jgi:tetratricopeptide (TPR) repeat protein
MPQEKPEILYWTATCYAKMGDFQRAAAEYLKVPALYAGMGRWDLTSECEAARLYERMGEYRKAVSLYKKILNSDGATGDLGKEALARMDQLNGILESQ